VGRRPTRRAETVPGARNTTNTPTLIGQPRGGIVGKGLFTAGLQRGRGRQALRGTVRRNGFEVQSRTTSPSPCRPPVPVTAQCGLFGAPVLLRPRTSTDSRTHGITMAGGEDGQAGGKARLTLHRHHRGSAGHGLLARSERPNRKSGFAPRRCGCPISIPGAHAPGERRETGGNAERKPPSAASR